MRRVLVLAMLLSIATLAILPAARLTAQSVPARPPVTGVVGFAVKTKDMAKARTFYSTILGFDEAFTIRNPTGGSDLTAFKINDGQYIYVAPDLKDDSESACCSSASRPPTRGRSAHSSRPRASRCRPR
jgi:hypothetical protein